MNNSIKEQRRGIGNCPRLIFTSDFHELLRGDLLAGPCVLRYDPHRIVPVEEIEWLPASQRPIHLSVRFHPTNQSWEGDLRAAPGNRLEVVASSTGQGTMLETEFPIPPGCEELECWFSYVDNAGVTHWDSEGGENFWLRFPLNDLTLTRAEVALKPKDALSQLEIELEADDNVDSITVRWRHAQPPGEPRQESALVLSPDKATTAARRVWKTSDGGIPIPHGATVVFDLVYTVGSHTFTDDNEGTWYIAA